MTETKFSMLANTTTDFAAGMFSGLTARLLGWPIERIWYLRQANPVLNYKTLINQTFAKDSFSLLLTTYRRAGLMQSAAHAIAYLGVVNSVIRYNKAFYPEKSSSCVGVEAGLASACSETIVTFTQERKKAMLFSGAQYTQIPLFSLPSLRCLMTTLLKNIIVNSSTVVIFLACYSHLNKMTEGTVLAPATSFFSGCVAAGPTQIIGMPFVNLQNRVLRDSAAKIGQHVSSIASLRVKEIYSGILARWTHQMFLGGTSFTLLSLFNKQNIRLPLVSSNTSPGHSP